LNISLPWQINAQEETAIIAGGNVQKSPPSKAAAILTRGAYSQYVSTAKWRERRWRLFSTFPEEFLDGRRDILWFGGGSEALMDPSRFIDEEFGEVPFDGFRSQEAWHLVFEMLIAWMRIGTIDFDLGEHGKADTVMGLAKILNFFMASWILAAKLIARKSQYLKSLCLILLVKSL